MPTVELVYDLDCPNVVATRTRLLTAFSQAGVVPRWSEHLCGDLSAPAHARGFGSPTILVDRGDVVHSLPTDAACCRIYRDEAGATSGVPPLASIVDALNAAVAPRTVLSPRSRWQRTVAVLPAVGAAFLPKVACPACWPAYAGVLGALGLGFLMDTAVLLPLTAVFLALGVGALGFRARSRHGYRPLAIGVVAATIVLVGKFAFESDPAMYVGLGLLVAASLWNTWPRARATACPACPPAG